MCLTKCLEDLLNPSHIKAIFRLHLRRSSPRTSFKHISAFTNYFHYFQKFFYDELDDCAFKKFRCWNALTRQLWLHCTYTKNELINQLNFHTISIHFLICVRFISTQIIIPTPKGRYTQLYLNGLELHSTTVLIELNMWEIMLSCESWVNQC